MYFEQQNFRVQLQVVLRDHEIKAFGCPLVVVSSHLSTCVKKKKSHSQKISDQVDLIYLILFFLLKEFPSLLIQAE